MLRRFLLTTIRRALVLLLLICLGCIAQSAPPDLALKIEHQVRAYYNLPADVKVRIGSIVPSTDWPGYDTVQVTIDSDGKQKDYQFLLSKDRQSMMRLTKFDLRVDAFAALMSQINVAGRPTRGAKGAKVVLINFDDFECPYCSAMHRTLFPEILKEYGDRVTFIYKDYPLSEIHPWAIHAAVDANCLAAQNADAYWDFADYIHANKKDIDNEKTPGARLEALDKLTIQQGQKHNVDATRLQACVKEQNENAVRASMQEGDALGVNATPTMYVNGQKIDGAVSPGEIRAALDAALKEAGQPVPDHTPSPAPK